MITNPVLVDENGKKIYTSQETDKHPSEIIYESKFSNFEDFQVIEKNKPNQKISSGKPEANHAGPFFINMVDGEYFLFILKVKKNIVS